MLQWKIFMILPTKLPAKANVIGAIMFAGLIFIL